MKRVLVCGSNGLLGQKLAWMLQGENEFEVLHTSHHRFFHLGNYPFDYTQLDISVRNDVKSLVSSFRPDVIFNAAAMANVDLCEKEKEQAWKTNVIGVENLVEISRRIGAKFIHVSTDYVFDGRMSPYSEESRVNPVNYYGKTKLAGENVVRKGGIDHAILRTVLVYGSGVQLRENFALWVINSLKQGKAIRCVDDQISNPTHVTDLARAMISIVQLERSGMYHISGPEAVSRYDFASRIAEYYGLDKDLIERVKTPVLALPAVRPLNTTFSIDKARRDLSYHPMTIDQGLGALKEEIQNIHLN